MAPAGRAAPQLRIPQHRCFWAYGCFIEQETQRSLLKQTPAPVAWAGKEDVALAGAGLTLCGCGAVLLPEAVSVLCLLARVVLGLNSFRGVRSLCRSYVP